MRGIILTTKFWRKQIGGVGEYTQQLVSQMQKIGDQILIITPPTPGDKKFYQQAGYKVLRRSLPVNQFSFFKQILNLSFFKTLKEIKNTKPDYLLCNRWYEYLGLLTFLYSKILSVPYFAFAFGTDINKILLGRGWLSTSLCKLFFLNATKVYCISRYTKSLAIKLGVLPEKITIIPGGLDMEFIHQNTTKKSQVSSRVKSLKRKLKGKLVISTFSRLESYKGIDKVIASLPRILEDVPNAVYLIAGYGPDANRLKKLAIQCKVANKVFFVDYITGASKYFAYKLSDIFIMASRESSSGGTEGFGIVYLEAAYFKNPCIASRLNGSADAVKNNLTGLLLNPYSQSEITRILIMFAKDKKLRRRMGQAGHNRAKQFTWVKAARMLQEDISNTILHK
jgi:phosphatidyl-myo-inositol dimannoside synthase